MEATLDCREMDDPGLNPSLLRQALEDYVNRAKRSGTSERALLTSIAAQINEIARRNKMDDAVTMQMVQNWVSGRTVAKGWCAPLRAFLGLGEASTGQPDPIVAKLDQILHVLTMVLAAASHGISDAVERASGRELPPEQPKSHKIKRS